MTQRLRTLPGVQYLVNRERARTDALKALFLLRYGTPYQADIVLTAFLDFEGRVRVRKVQVARRARGPLGLRHVPQILTGADDHRIRRLGSTWPQALAWRTLRKECIT